MIHSPLWLESVRRASQRRARRMSKLAIILAICLIVEAVTVSLLWILLTK